MREREYAEKKDYIAFKLNGVTYLPHYQDSKLFVGPGYPALNKNVYTSTQMLEAGAKASIMHLWKRVEHGLGRTSSLAHAYKVDKRV